MNLENKLSDKHQKRNFLLNVIDGAVYMMAVAMIPQQTILPAFIKKFTSNEYLINLIPMILVFGYAMPQIFIARHTESLKFRKKFMLVTGLGQRLPWLFLGLFILFVPKDQMIISLVLFFVFYFIYSLSCGINVPIWLDLVAKLTPTEKRGKLFAYRHIMGGVLGIMGAYVAKIILKKCSFPDNYSILFLIFFVLTSISLGILIFLKEPPSQEVKKKTSFHEFLKTIPDLVKKDKNYRNFIISNFIGSLSYLSGGLIAVYGIDKFGLHNKDYIFAQISLYSVLTMIVAVFLLGHLGDKIGHKINLILLGIFRIVSLAMIIIMKDITLFIISFIISSMAQSCYIVSKTNISLEFCHDADRPTYISVNNTLAAPFSFVAPILGAFIARTWGYKELFWIAILLNMVYILYFSIFVKEPRKHGVSYRMIQQ